MGHDNPDSPSMRPEDPRFGLEDRHGDSGRHSHSTSSFAVLALGALGVVYGDIGTSPLYALRETVLAATGAASGGHGGAVDIALTTPVPREVIIGVLSLILWSLVIVVTLKYVVLLLSADNNGEGGTLTLVALAQRALGRMRGGVVLFLGMAGAALFYGDAVITPAISVLSAVEGIKLVTPALNDYVVMIASGILIALFLVQSRGTEKVANFFGPVMMIWFLTLAGLGIYHIADDLGVFASINPYWGVHFFVHNPGVSLAVLGSVCLAVTGAEALYADMGHFGRGPIRSAWIFMVFPGALAELPRAGCAHPLGSDRRSTIPFYKLAPDWFLLPLVILATIATIIASQAVITGAFSLTRQAIQLGLLPRLEIKHTSEHTSGQIYHAACQHALLLVVVLLLVFDLSLFFGAVANAYGISVFGAMTVDAHSGLHRDMEGVALVVSWRPTRWSLCRSW